MIPKRWYHWLFQNAFQHLGDLRRPLRNAFHEWWSPTILIRIITITCKSILSTCSCLHHWLWKWLMQRWSVRQQWIEMFSTIKRKRALLFLNIHAFVSLHIFFFPYLLPSPSCSNDFYSIIFEWTTFYAHDTTLPYFLLMRIHYILSPLRKRRRNRIQNRSGKQEEEEEEEDVVSPSQVTGELSFGQRQLQLHHFPTFYFFFFSALHINSNQAKQTKVLTIISSYSQSFAWPGWRLRRCCHSVIISVDPPSYASSWWSWWVGLWRRRRVKMRGKAATGSAVESVKIVFH